MNQNILIWISNILNSLIYIISIVQNGEFSMIQNTVTNYLYGRITKKVNLLTAIYDQ